MADASSQEIFMAMDYGKGSLVEGESLDDVHPGEIRILSLSLSASRSVDASARKDPNGQADFGDVNVTIKVNKASAALFSAAVKASQFATVIFSFRKHGAAKTGPANGDYLQWGLQNVYITSFQHSHGGSDTAGIDTLSLVYDKIEIWYGQQEGQGALTQTFQKGWHVGQNKELGELKLPYKNKKAKT